MSTNTTQLFRNKRNIEFHPEEIRQQNIKQLLLKFTSVNDSMKALKKKDTSSLSELDLRRHSRQLNMLIGKKNVLSTKLSSLGYKTERRGRPKKDDSEKYKSTHIRASYYFTEANATKLKLLKENAYIENISSFLNELLDAYFAASKVGDNNAK